jgi:hypothetical protein
MLAVTRLHRCGTAEEAEALAALSGIKLLTDRGHDKIILEVDAANVAKGSPLLRPRQI